VVASVDENSVHHPDPGIDVIQTAQLKARAVAERVTGSEIIVAADTTVVIDGERLNKPIDAADSRKMLRRLRGRVHQVYTGIVLLDTGTGQIITDVAAIDVPMRHYTNDEIDAYIATGDPSDKAGAYAIQHPDFRPVSGLSGCYAGVMGLPLCHLTRALRRFGLLLTDDIAQRCQQELQYDCPIYKTILGS
jgi:MAF protein